MSKPHAIALLGFTAFERSTFESFFRLAARRVPGYAIVDNPDDSELIVANADDSATMGALFDRPPRAQVLLVGADDAGTGWPIEPRPLKLMGVLTAVDRMLGHLPPVPAPAPRAARRPGAGFAETRPSTLEDAALASAGSTAQPADDGILVVDGDDKALLFMRKLLHRVGFTSEPARSAGEALARLDARPWRIVFMDAAPGGMDGYQACKLIKQRDYGSGKPPVVVLMTGKTGAIDRIKGTMAGCDASLAKPPDERALLKLLARFDDQVQRGFQPTRLGKDADKPRG